MARVRPQLAKLSRPRLHAPVPRDRLFRLLDGLRGSAVVWVEGPPGAGKTTAICTYLDTARLPGVWYQLDSADSDAATFFYYLRVAAGELRGGRWRLPLFTPAHREDLRGFGRRFFRALFQRLSPGAVIVFDNYHEVDADSPVHEILACAAEEVPEGANIIIISRVEPPKAWARARIINVVATLNWDALQFTVDEIRSIPAPGGGLPRSVLESLHRESHGWAAGVVLMLERLQRAGSLDTEQGIDGPEATFDYFASQIFDSASAETREVMMKTALVPTVSVALAEAVTANPGAGKILESLYRRRLFVDRRGGRQISYQYHALFRAFLRHQAATQYSHEQRRQLITHVAGLLREYGQEEDAFALYCEGHAWDSAVAVLGAMAPRLIGQGRLRAIEDWVGNLAETTRREDPDVAYWMGMALEPARPNEALPWLQRAYEKYAVQGNDMGMLLSTAGILDALYVDYSDFVPMRPWVDRLTRALGAAPVFSSPEVELRVQLSLLAIVHNAPDNRLLPACAARVEALLAEPFDVNLKVVAGQRLLSYGDAASDPELCRRVVAMISPLLDSPQLTPANAAIFISIWGYHLYIVWKVDDALECFDRVRSISQREGLHDETFRIMAYRALCQRRADQLPAAEATLAELATLPKPRHGARASMAEILKALMAYSRGDLALAIEIGMAAQRTVDASSNVFNAVVYRTLNADILIAAGKLDLAERNLTQARSLASGTVIDGLRAYIALNQAHLFHVRGDKAVRNEFLREALSFAGTEGGRARLRWFPRAMATLFPIALRENIEPEIVRLLVKTCSLVPPTSTLEDWPWPIKVYTLGRFEIWREGQRVTFDRKAPRKTLALLRALIAFGASEVAEERLLEALWPDDEGDAAHRSFTQALHRLRRILGDNTAIRQVGGKLSVDLQRCWVDALAFERLVGSDAGVENGTQDAIDLYRGAFLKEEDSPGWVISARERLRADFVDAVGKVAALKERSLDFDGAIDVYRRGLAADELVEPFYQGLMRCYRRLDRRSDAVGAYRRLRQTLSVVLGIQPSATTEKIYREI